jgi:hypothetical protein
MTLTAALREALDDSADLAPLRVHIANGHVANAIACALVPPTDDDRAQRAVRAVMAMDAGCPVEDVRLVVHDAKPHSAEWTAAAIRLAKFVDGVTP